MSDEIARNMERLSEALNFGSMHSVWDSVCLREWQSTTGACASRGEHGHLCYRDRGHERQCRCSCGSELLTVRNPMLPEQIVTVRHTRGTDAG